MYSYIQYNKGCRVGEDICKIFRKLHSVEERVYSRYIQNYMLYFHTVKATGFLLLKVSTVIKKIAFTEGDIYPGQVLSCEFSRLQGVRSFNYAIQEGIFHLHKSIESTSSRRDVCPGYILF